MQPCCYRSYSRLAGELPALEYAIQVGDGSTWRDVCGWIPKLTFRIGVHILEVSICIAVQQDREAAHHRVRCVFLSRYRTDINNLFAANVDMGYIAASKVENETRFPLDD